MKKLCLLICLCLIMPLGAYADNFQDVDALGNIWIVTIDGSGSMLNTNQVAHMPRNQTPQSLANLVHDRMKGMKRKFSSTMNFRKDRFVFYTSGYSYDSAKGISNELARAESLDKSFIHHTDAKLHSFNNYNQLLAHIHKLMRSMRFDHDLSFVSQIRTFSIVKTIALLKEKGIDKEFNTLRVLTITDDADQNDQWLVDNKHFMAADKVSKGTPVSKRIKDTLQRYVYNDLIGTGAGRFEPLHMYDSHLPHIWQYEYSTIASQRDTLYDSYLSIKAVDGNVVHLESRSTTIQGDPVCFFKIDSIIVDGVKTMVNKSFADTLDVRVAEYRNGLRRNEVTVCGQIQLEYVDDIYGPHYRKLYFVQREVCPAGTLWGIYVLLIGFLVTVIAVYILYRFAILPRRKLMIIYSANGSMVTVRRGFRKDWKNQLTTVVDYGTSNMEIVSVRARKSHNVQMARTGFATSGADILICSHVKLRFSEDCLRHTSLEDLNTVYSTHTGEYPEMLKRVYERTICAKLRDKYIRTSSVWVAKLIRRTIALLNRVAPDYYYYYKDMTDFESVYVDSPTLLPGKRLVIVSGSIDTNVEITDVDRILTAYYADDSIVDADALISRTVTGDKECWRIILLNDYTQPQTSIRAPKVIYRYVKAVDENSRAIYANALLSYARRQLKGSQVCLFEPDCSSQHDVLKFNAEVCIIPGFISFVEYKKQPKSQLLYSPFEDGNVSSKYVALDTGLADGHLYQSFLPYNYMRKIFVQTSQEQSALRRLSVEIIRTDNCSTGRMSLGYDRISYRGVNIEFND